MVLVLIWVLVTIFPACVYSWMDLWLPDHNTAVLPFTLWLTVACVFLAYAVCAWKQVRARTLQG